MRIVLGKRTRFRRMGKKASLEISIQAIVIVVLAMTLLGLGLGFVRNLFSTTTDLTTGVTDQIRNQILDDLRRGDKKLSFPTDKISLERSEKKILAIGVKNKNSNELEFKIIVNMLDDTGAIISGTTATDFGEFLYNKGVQTLGVNDANVYPIEFTAGASADSTEIFEVIIQDQAGSLSTYSSKTFFIQVE